MSERGTLELVTAPTAEPIDRALAKAHLRVSHAHEDTYIDQCARAARAYGENYLERRFITQTWKLYLDGFPCSGRAIVVPYPPLQSVSSIAYVDENGDTQTWASSNYIVDITREPGWIRLAYGSVWPTTRLQPRAVTITFVCGYGAAGSNLPADLLQLLLVDMSGRFEIREPVLVGTTPAAVPGLERAWMLHRTGDSFI